MSSNITFSNRSNARRAGVKAGIPVESVEITVHKVAGEKPRFGFRAASPAQAATAEQRKPAAKVPTAPREERNGVKRPAAGGKCAAVWDYLDKHPKASPKEAQTALPKLNANNVSIETYSWRKFHGVTGRIAA